MYSLDEQEWKDVEPIPQDDGPDPLAPINYDPEYSFLMNYFRAISQKEEYSERALKLTGLIISHNPAHYTIWYYRQKTLFALGNDLYDELKFVEEQITENPKNYQLWHHRQIIVEKLMDGSSEIRFINQMLKQDAKNYHAWTYRQWVIKTFNFWDEELLYLDRLLEDDVRNNSAWNQRYFILFHNPNGPSEELISREIEYAISKIKITPNNISPWNYVKGVIAKSNRELNILEDLSKEFIEGNNISPYALGCLVNIYEKRAIAGSEEDKNEGVKTCTLLAEKHDKIRSKYWEYRKNVLLNL